MRELSLYRWRRNSGSVLILTFWALGLLSVFAVYMGYAARAKLDEVDRLNKYAMLRHIAKAGVSMAKAKLQGVFFVPGNEGGHITTGLLAYNDGADIETKVGDGKALVSIIDMERYLNINTAPREVLSRLIQRVCAVSEGDAASLTDAILDWRDADSSPQPMGAEDDYYAALSSPYNCKDAFFNETDELLLVRGFSGKIYEDLSSFVTVCGDGAVNINTASPEVLLAVGLDSKLVDKVMQHRPGNDGASHTEDDGFFDFRKLGESSQVEIYCSDSPVVFTPEDIAVFTQKFNEGLLGSYAFNFFVQSTAIRYSQNWRFVIWALFSKVNRSDLPGNYDISLRYWRTSP